MTGNKIPLEERMRGKGDARKLPTAMGLYVVDFSILWGRLQVCSNDTVTFMTHI